MRKHHRGRGYRDTAADRCWSGRRARNVGLARGSSQSDFEAPAAAAPAKPRTSGRDHDMPAMPSSPARGRARWHGFKLIFTMMGHGHVHRPNLPRQLCQRLISQDARIGGNVSAHVSGMDVNDMTFDPELLAQLADETGIFIRRLPQMVVNVADDGNEAGFVFRSRMATDAKALPRIRAPALPRTTRTSPCPSFFSIPHWPSVFGFRRRADVAERLPARAGRSPSPRLGSAGARFLFNFDRAPFAIHQYYGDRDRSACFAERHFVWSILFSVIMLATALSNPIWPDWLPNILMIAGVPDPRRACWADGSRPIPRTAAAS